ncbi:hypothetical protein DY000_02007600 [Brassica cretica]|uniref:Uncharacterized protein n=1 Tax=Brassica cretica TaxID=69181 RepID=A0ABQ7CIE0_BRACR|nr:hypothetical protein DY000_02007600 [Brassica cretica]
MKRSLLNRTSKDYKILGRFLLVGVGGSLPYSEIWKVLLIGNLSFLGAGVVPGTYPWVPGSWDLERSLNGDPEVPPQAGQRSKDLYLGSFIDRSRTSDPSERRLFCGGPTLSDASLDP